MIKCRLKKKKKAYFMRNIKVIGNLLWSKMTHDLHRLMNYYLFIILPADSPGF